MPLAAMTQAASRANSVEWFRQSKQMATPLARGLLPLRQDHLGKGLGGVADDMDVHLVQAHAHGAPQAGGAEGQLAEEAALDLLVVVADACQLRLLLLASAPGWPATSRYSRYVVSCSKISFPFYLNAMRLLLVRHRLGVQSPWPPPAGRRGHTGSAP